MGGIERKRSKLARWENARRALAAKMAHPRFNIPREQRLVLEDGVASVVIRKIFGRNDLTPRGPWMSPPPVTLMYPADESPAFQPTAPSTAPYQCNRVLEVSAIDISNKRLAGFINLLVAAAAEPGCRRPSRRDVAPSGVDRTRYDAVRFASVECEELADVLCEDCGFRLMREGEDCYMRLCD